jgi:hypothetical protein
MYAIGGDGDRPTMLVRASPHFGQAGFGEG